VDVLGSVSRVASKVNSRPHLDAAATLRRVLAARKAAQDLIDVGAYQAGTNPLVDAALNHEHDVSGFLQQPMDESTAHPESWQRLGHLTSILGAAA
jgi:flagellum-specific ATP synthase